MDNFEPVSKIDPNQLPEGFTAAATTDDPQQQQKQQMEEQKQAVLEQALTPEALARLRRIKLVKESKAVSVENAIVNMAMSGKLPGRINEGKLIEMLERGNAQKAKAASTSISIQRKQYAFDSDDDDDNDDDLM